MYHSLCKVLDKCAPGLHEVVFLDVLHACAGHQLPAQNEDRLVLIHLDGQLLQLDGRQRRFLSLRQGLLLLAVEISGI